MTHTKAILVAVALSSVVACSGSQQQGVDGDAPPGQDTAAPAPTDAPDVAPGPTGEPTAAPTATQKACTEMGCENGFKVELNAKDPKKTFGKGAYTVEVLSGGKASKCEISLPLPACEKGPAAKCTGDIKVDLVASGCALPPDAHSFGPVSFPESPAEVEIIVKKDKKKLGEGKFKPTYKTVQPNGPGCEPTCNQAPAETITLGG
jgi:hypothetical protein